MYSRFAPNDEIFEELVNNHPFATVVTGVGAEMQISHLPLVLEKRGAEWILVGHLSRANPHWKALDGNETTAVFHGPHAYITPLWYEKNDVPTWNYAVAHLSGTARLLENEEDTLRALRVLSEHMEGPQGWKFYMPEDLAEPGILLKAIVGFEIPVSLKRGNLKFSQNKSPVDVQGVLDGLASRGDEQSQQVKEWMIRLAKR